MRPVFSKLVRAENKFNSRYAYIFLKICYALRKHAWNKKAIRF